MGEEIFFVNYLMIFKRKSKLPLYVYVHNIKEDIASFITQIYDVDVKYVVEIIKA